MKNVGLVGGISWVSTMDYYRMINESVNARLGGLQFAQCMICSLNFGAVQSRGWDNSFDLLLNACEQLKRSGVDAIALCANTAHLFADELEQSVQMPIIHIVTETAKVISKEGYKNVGLIGTKFTMEMGFYEKRLEQFGLKVLTPALQETRDYIQQTVKEELGVGCIKQDTKAKYISIVNELIDRGADCIVLGCTEIPMLISQQDFNVPVFDTAKIHSDAIVNYMLEQ